MTSFGFASYIVAAVFYALLALLLCTSWRGRLEGGLLLLAAVISELWAAVGAFAGNSELVTLKHFLALEVLRNIAWSAFLWHLLSYTKFGERRHWRNWLVLGYLELAAITIAAEIFPPFSAMLNSLISMDFRIFSHVAQAVIGLMLVEQLFRNTRVELRWTIKYLCLGLGAMFTYDFVLFSEALLFGRIDPNIWDARSLLNAFVVPLIAISAVRNPHWSVDIFVSRTMIFHTTGLMGMGLYLLGMASVGYYINEFGGTWGQVGQIVFIAAASLILLLLMFSGRIRARIRVFFNRHFFTYKYDYRKEWLDLNRTIARGDSADDLRVSCIRAAGDIVDSPGGALWLNRDGEYVAVAELNTQSELPAKVPDSDSLVAFLAKHKWVVEVPEYLQTPELYEGMNLTSWCDQLPEFWLYIPLMQRNELYGFIGLTKPLAAREINWEDHDLLKTVGQQLASYIGLIDASDELASSRQFEAYNRLSAFIVHDLKNLVAQLSLVVKNAERHKDNPDFIEDAMDTLANSVDKMNRLLSQLRKGQVIDTPDRQVDLADALEQVITLHSNMKPKPKLELQDQDVRVSSDRDKLISVLGHLVQNAQDATDDSGWVDIRLSKSANNAIIEIEDNGCGMDPHFIRERLFRPFDTTKGNAGMGIGVFETRQFVQAMKGVIGVESEVMQGTKFTLKLPLSNAAEEVETGVSAL